MRNQKAKTADRMEVRDRPSRQGGASEAVRQTVTDDPWIEVVFSLQSNRITRAESGSRASKVPLGVDRKSKASLIDLNVYASLQRDP